ncbi:MAG: zf-TFIIB domain-containing protein [Rhizobacter sp.]|jgi:Zn-finger nucleic acid-binding protein
MQCPVCPETTLLMSDRQGVEIDYCPKCRGVWLDRGELDKLIQLSAGAETPRAQPPVPQSAADTYRAPPQRRDFEDSDYGKRQHGGHYRKKSWLSDIFD